MARPQKTGLDYFPLNTDIMHNKKISLIEAEFGTKGFAIVTKLYCNIYSDRGYYLLWDEETKLLLAKAFGEPGSLIGEVVAGCVKRKIFNEDVFNMFGVLTGKSIQENYLSGASRRDRVEIEEAICLVDVNDYKNAISVNVNFKSVGINPQSKGEENKVKKKKVKETVGDHLFSLSPFNDFEKFKSEFTGTDYECFDLKIYYEKVKNWSASKNAKRTDWIATARNFMIGDKSKGVEVLQKIEGQTQKTVLKPTEGGGVIKGNFFQRKV